MMNRLLGVLGAALLLVVQIFSASTDPLHFQVSLRKDSLVQARSCQHTFSQVELLNLHTTDHIWIHSIQTGKEETTRIVSYDDNGTVRVKVPVRQGLPQQLHASRLPSESLSLGPGQVAIVPITFLPRFPVSVIAAQATTTTSPVFSVTTTNNASGGDNSNTSNPHLPPATASAWQQADWQDWVRSSVDPSAHRSNRPFVPHTDSSSDYSNNNNNNSGGLQQHQMFQVSTTLKVDTNRGVVELPVTATSIQSNEYGLPDTLYFDNNDSVMTTDGGGGGGGETTTPLQQPKQQPLRATTTADTSTSSSITKQKPFRVNKDGPAIWIVDSDRALRETEAPRSSSTTTDPAQDCYDLFLKHPGNVYRPMNQGVGGATTMELVVDENKDISILEVLLSRTDHLSLQVLPEKALDRTLVATERPTQVIRDWTIDGGPLILPHDGKQHYVATVCTAGPDETVHVDEEAHLFWEELGHWIDAGDAEYTLGFLQIRTDFETLFVGLERTRADPAASVRATAAAGGAVQAGGVQVAGVQTGVQAVPGMTINVKFRPMLPSVAAEEPVEALPAPPPVPDLKAVPESVQIHLLSSASPTATASIGIKNMISNDPITLMRVSAAMELEDPELVDQLGLQIKVRLVSDDEDGLVSIAPRSTLKEAFVLECSVDWDRLTKNLAQDSINFSGSVIVRATSENWTYLEWMEETKADPAAGSNLVLDVPFTISIVNGKIELGVQGTTHPFPLFWSMETSDDVETVSSAFFPSTPYDVVAMLGGEDLDFSFDNKGMDHQLRAFTNVETGLKIKSATIASVIDTEAEEQSRICDRFDVSLVRSDNSIPSDLGMVHLRYRFPQASLLGREKTEGVNTSDISPTTCYLRLTTEPNTGVHLTPLVIYPGKVDVSASLFRSDLLDEEPKPSSVEDENAVWHHAIVGFDSLVEWFRETTTGQALRSVLDSNVDNRKSPERDFHLLGRYLYSLARQSMSADNSKLRPVLLEVGAIAQSEMETLPLYFTNHNPVPISITIDVGEVEGMSISLGRDPSIGRGDGNSLLDYLPRKGGSSVVAEPLIESGPLKGHPINGIRQFLLSDEVAGSFLTRFPYRDAVSVSESAVAKQPLLRTLYQTYALGGFHRESRPFRFSPDAWSLCEQSEHPPMYGSFGKKLPNRRMPGPIILSSDRKTVRRLPVCWDRDSEPTDHPSDGSSVLLPPGGVARFDINLRAPPSAVLDNDITEFIATGLVLSTDHGEVMPILVAFAALKGKLEVSHVPVHLTEDPQSPTPSTSSQPDSVIRVPLGLFVEPSPTKDTALKIPPRPTHSLADLAHTEIIPRNVSLSGESGVSLFMKSSFSRDVRLTEVSSCNPWFEVVLNEQQSDEADPFLGVNIGLVSSIVSCRDSYGGQPDPSGFPSFFRCALNWLAQKAELQPLGCGLLPAMEKGSVETDGNLVAERGGVQRATRAFERALLVSEWAYRGLPEYSGAYGDHLGSAPFKSGRERSRDGVVASPVLDVIADAWDSWRVASEFGVRVLSTSLRATIEYNSTLEEDEADTSVVTSTENKANLLSVALRNLTVETVLQTPKLLDIERVQSRGLYEAASDEGSPAIVEVPTTLVATVSSLTLPVRNPTAVPIRVRLAVAPPQIQKEDVNNDEILTELAVDENVRASFLGNFASPYVQSGKKTHMTPKESARSLWWDGDGAYFLSDYHGDLIRSHHNLTIKAGTGAHVTLVNPSLLSNTAFIVGCGPRCGVRDDTPKKIAGAPKVDLRMSSPVGASAAGGVTLIGRKRSNLPQANQVASDILSLAAGGSLLSEGDGPAPFAIPFGALDEIIIPPFGEAELGPILFRPPGRSPLLGCGASGSADGPQDCSSKTFESMLFLENSLTGLERVVVRGRALWESVVFLEPPSKDGLDDFGDVEMRNGRYTLVFPGTSANPTQRSSARGAPHSVVKEVVVHNNGDVPVSFSSMYLSDTARLHEKHARHRKDRLCSLGDFHVLDCSSNAETMPPLELLPGQNRSIFIEHYAQCSKKTEFVALNLEYQRDGLRSDHSQRIPTGGTTSVSNGIDVPYVQTSVPKYAKATEWKKSFHGRKIELLVGYHMTDDEFSSCVSATRGAVEDASKSGANLFSMPQNASQTRYRGKTLAGKLYGALSVLSALLVLSVASAALIQRYVSRKETFETFQATLERSRMKLGGAKDASNHTLGDNWTAAFHCLSRADPASSDLQTLGREQVRQVVLARYRSMSILPPQCFNSAGAFHRERVGLASSPGRQTSSKKNGNPGSNERIRTLSDAIFRNVTLNDDIGTGHVPCELGWRTAAARGIISSSSLDASPLVLRTSKLVRRRSHHSTSTEEDEDSDESMSIEDDEDECDEESVTFHASTADLAESDVESFGEDRDENGSQDAIENNEPVPVLVEPDTEKKSLVSAVNGNEGKTDSVIVVKPQKERERREPERIDSKKADNTSTKKELPSPKQPNPESNAKANKPAAPMNKPVPRSPTVKVKKAEGKPAEAARKEAVSSPKKPNGRKEKQAKPTTPRSERRKPKFKVDDSTDDNFKDQADLKKERRKKTPRSERSQKGKSAENVSTQRISPRKSASSSRKAERGTEKKVAPVSPSEQPGPPIFRPPPGLAPPPGFDKASLNETPKNAPLHSSQLLSPGSLDAQAAEEFLARPSTVSRSLTGESYVSLGELPLPSSSSPLAPYRIVAPSLSTDGFPGVLDDSGSGLDIDPQAEMTGFDVMDFLDGILNDASASGDHDGAETGGILTETQAAGPTSTVLPFSSSSNPWAAVEGEGHRSRAAAYGISFEEEMERAAEQAANIDLPLLTPAAILTASQVGEEEETESGDALFATLLAE